MPAATRSRRRQRHTSHAPSTTGQTEDGACVGSSPQSLPTPSLEAWRNYTYTPTEKSIFAPSPYKALLLPLWRFASLQLARTSAEQIYAYFVLFIDRDDFVGADNARKFLQMGMTRAGRYANHKGGRKYVKDKDGDEAEAEGGREERGKGTKRKVVEAEGDWEGRKEKKEASDTFRGYWQKAKENEGYMRLKDKFLREHRALARCREAGGGGGGKKGSI